jgi:hypothetical protein
MKVLKISQTAVTLADQDTPFLPGSTVVAYGAATNVLEGTEDGTNWTTIQTFAASDLFVTVNLGEYIQLRASSSDYVYLLNN